MFPNMKNDIELYFHQIPAGPEDYTVAILLQFLESRMWLFAL